VEYFSDDLDEFQIAEQKDQARYILMAFFDYNHEHEDRRRFLYNEFPENYTWVPVTRSWKLGKGTKVLAVCITVALLRANSIIYSYC
jgi:hypothetical protein